jgi:cytochrome c peroxidase
MKPRPLVVAFTLVFMSTALMRASHPAAEAPAQDGSEHSLAAGLDCGSEPCAAVFRGLVGFLDRGLHGLQANGRSCADCHMPTDSFQLSPAGTEARFQRLQAQRGHNRNADDPLFRPIDADDFFSNGDQASDYSNLRQNGLIRIMFPLPDGIRLIDPKTNMPSSELNAEVWRMVPSVNNVALTGSDNLNAWPRGPNPTGGYQLDGRFATLEEQALGAFQTHAQASTIPSQRMLDDLGSFQRVLFSNPRVRDLATAVRAGVVPLPDPDLPLTDLEQQGKAVFHRACAQCHGGPGQSTSQPAPVPVIRYHDIATQCPRPVDPVSPARFQFAPCPERLARNARTYEVTLKARTPLPGGVVLEEGTKVRRTSSDPGRAFQTAFVGGPPPFDDWNKFDVPTLYGIKDTAPYFHNNSADTLEAVVDHYIELFKLIKAGAPPNAPPPAVASTNGLTFDRQPKPEERAALLAYLRKQ